MIKLIDTLSYGSKLRAVSPLWKSGFAALLFLLSYAAHPLVQLLIAAWMGHWTARYARIPLRIYAGLLGVSLLFYMASVPALLLEAAPADAAVAAVSGAPAGFAASAASAVTDIWGSGSPGGFAGIILFKTDAWQIYVSFHGIGLALHLLCRVAACLTCLLFLLLTTPLSELLQVLRVIRMPALILEIMLIMYRFLFILEDTARQLYVAQLARGGYAGYRQKLKDLALLIVRLFTKTIQRYKNLAQGLAARGFIDELHMAPYEAKPVRLRYKLESCAGIAGLLLLELWLVWRGLG
jgi:cobalt/nickel transport system permease protein